MKKYLKSFLLILLVSFFIPFSCTNVNEVLLTENATIYFNIDWGAILKKTIPDNTSGIIISLKSHELKEYKKSFYIVKGENFEEEINVYPGEYDLVIFCVEKEIVDDKTYFKILTVYGTSFSINPEENKEVSAILEYFEIASTLSDVSNFSIGDTFYIDIDISNLLDFIDIYSFYYILDFNESGQDDSDLIKSVRVTKDYIERESDTHFKITCNTSIDDFLDTECLLKFKVEFRLDDDCFENNFFEENGIYKIYYYIENVDLGQLIDHTPSGSVGFIIE